MLTSEETRKKFIKFWEELPRNHKQIPSASLIPKEDSTLLFVNSGMFPLVNYLSGAKHPMGSRLMNVQNCIRTNDIEEVGDARHLVLFEMVGNWSLGDYFKAEQIPWVMELFVEEFGLDPKRIYVSVWGGDEDVPRDDKAIDLWKKVFSKYGVKAEFSEDITNIPENLKEGETHKYRIFPYIGVGKGWWERAHAVGELGGTTTEVFYDFGEIINKQEKYHINDESGRFIEVGNSVFMQYRLNKNMEWEKLSQKNVDFGGGFERIVMAVQDKPSVYETDLFKPFIEKIEDLSGLSYSDDMDIENKKSFRIVAEHARSSVFILAEKVQPDNKDRGYILRRLIRRMIRHGAKLGIENNFSKVLAQEVIKKMSTAYPLLKENEKFILAEIEKEENKFRKTLKRGLKELKKLLEKGQEIMGDKAFYLYETFGFPLEMIFEELELEKDDMTRIKKDFKKAMQEHKEKSRAGMDKKFKGGLADNKEIHKKYHTATHLLLRALQEVLGDHVHQAGSNITAKRLRFDFTHSDQLTEEEIGKVEEIVNTKIKENLNVFRTDMSKETAKKIPNVEFMEHVDYPDIVSVYSIGLEEEPYDNTEGKLIDTTELRDKFKDAYTVEFCMGPHVENTSELAKKGEFKIIDQDNIGAGKVRVKGVLMV